MVIPYLAPFSWYAGNKQTYSRCLNRCRLIMHDREMQLSVPVCGGGRRLRSPRAYRYAEISGHGHWTHVHLGAIEAAYGRTPFYIHIQPPIQTILSACPRHLHELCSQLHHVCERFLNVAAPLHSPLHDEALRRGHEILKLIDPDISILDPLMRFGPETILAIEAAKSLES